MQMPNKDKLAVGGGKNAQAELYERMNTGLGPRLLLASLKESLATAMIVLTRTAKSTEAQTKTHIHAMDPTTGNPHGPFSIVTHAWTN